MNRLKNNDIVEVISGSHTGKQGKILRFNKDKTRAFVEKVAMVIKHKKPTQTDPAGGRIEIESSVHVSNLMLVDPKTKKPGRVGIKEESGKKVRYFKKTGNTL